MFKDLNDADYWAFRAEEARTKAEEMKTPHTRSLMLKISEEYERLAVQAQVRSAEAAIGKTLDEVFAMYRRV